MKRDDLRARGDRDLAERLLGEAEIRKAIGVDQHMVTCTLTAGADFDRRRNFTASLH